MQNLLLALANKANITRHIFPEVTKQAMKIFIVFFIADMQLLYLQMVFS